MNPLSIGLIGTENEAWMAGINYCSSILYANSLLQPSESQIINLFLHKRNQKNNYYKDVILYAKSLHYYDYQFDSYLTRIRLVKHNAKAKLFGNRNNILTNNLPELLEKTNCKVIYPANALLSKGPNHIKKISWIPDFQYKHYPEFSPDKIRRDLINKRILKLSDLVVVSNEYSKQDILKYFPKYIHKVCVMPFTMWLGPTWHSNDHDRIIEKYQIPRKYIIYPSQFWRHKNHKRLFEAIAKVNNDSDNKINLVCTGNTSDWRFPSYFENLQSYIMEQKLQKNIRILGIIPRKEQVQLLRSAAAVVTPSLFEGWSALLDESQSLGKKVFVSDIPMVREQHDQNLIYFDPDNTLDLADKLLAYWPKLIPGPDLKSEKTGLDNYYIKLKIFAEQFSNICNSAI